VAYKNYLIVDFGASNGRVLVGRFDGRRFDIEEIHRFDNRPVYVAGTLYWDVLRLFSELKIGIRKATHQYKEISCLGIDTWGVDCGFIDKNGKLLSNPVHYRDEKRNTFCQQAYNLLDKREIFDLTGTSVSSILTIFHVYGLKIDSAPEFTDANSLLMMPDLFNYFLTGQVRSEFSSASTTGAFNIRNKTWEDKILNTLDIPSQILGQVVLSGTNVGSIQQGLCRELEISPIPVIAPAGHDTASAVAGVPVIDDSKPWAYLSIGTWCIMGMETDKPVINQTVFDSGYGNEGGVGGGTFLAKNITGLWILQQCRNKWVKESGKDVSWDQIVSLADSPAPFKTLIDVDDPRFGRLQVDMPDVIVQYCKQTKQAVPESIGQIARCIYESLVMKFRFNLEQLETITGRRVETLHLVGGGTKNPLLCRWTADVTGIPVVAGPVEATAVGSLLMQLEGTGQISNLSDGRKIARDSSKIKHHQPKDKCKWDQTYQRYLGLLQHNR